MRLNRFNRVRQNGLSAAVLVLLGDEDEAEFTDLNLISNLERLRIAWLAVDVGTVQGRHHSCGIQRGGGKR